MNLQHKKSITPLFLVSSFLLPQISYSLELEEVVVTAQKREQGLQDVPIAITAFSSEKINELQMRDTFDIAKHTPGLTIAGTNKEGKPQIFLRGVGNSDFQQGSISPIASYADGVYAGANFSLAAQLLDLERVEVLKGPQGTLWGRNTTGGIINYVSRKAKPGEEFSGHVTASYAEYNEWVIDGAVSLPLSDNLGGRIAAKVYSSDGYFDAKGGGFKGDDLAEWTSYAVRANFVYEPGDELTLGTTLSYSNKDGSVSAAKHLGTVPAGGQPSCSRPGELGTNCGSSFGFVSSSDPHETEPEVDSFEDVESFGIIFDINYDWGDHQLTSITSYNSSEHQAFNDNDNAPIQALFGNDDNEYKGWSQELRVTSDYDGSVNWIAGFFYYEDELDIYAASDLPDLFGFLTGFLGFPILPTRTAQTIETETAALFGEVNFQVTEKLEAILGFRWTYDKRTAEANIATFNPLNAQFNSLSYSNANTVTVLENGKIDQSDSEPSGRFSLKYLLNEDTNLWFTVARGFKGGDSNSGADNAFTFTIVDPEFLTSAEAGVKYSSPENNLALDFSVFYYDYKDKQVFSEVPDPGGNNDTILSNAGALTITGVDASARWAPTDRLYIEAGFSYTDSEFDEFFNPGSGVDQKGNTTAYTPEITFNTIVAYTWPLSNGGTLSIQGDAVFTDDQFFTNDNDPILSQESQWLIGGNIGYKTPDERWDIRLWVKNLTDEEYLNGGFNFTAVSGGYIQYPGEPRIVGASVSLNF